MRDSKAQAPHSTDRSDLRITKNPFSNAFSLSGLHEVLYNPQFNEAEFSKKTDLVIMHTVDNKCIYFNFYTL